MSANPNQAPKPEALRWPIPVAPGGCLAVVAPASPIKKAALLAGSRWLTAQGLSWQGVGELTGPRPYREAEDRRRAAWVHQALQDPEIMGIICARGGYGSLRLLPHLDFDLIRRSGKLLVGFSDISALLGPIYQQCRLVGIHGPTVAQIPDLSPGAREHLRRLLLGDLPSELVWQPLRFLVPGRAQGPLLGGNLTTITHLVGTPYALHCQGHILFLEDHNEALYRLDRLLQQLKLSGSLEGVAGIVLGAFTNCGELERVWELFAHLGQTLGIPVAAGLPCGHQPDNYALPLGAAAVLDSAAARLKLYLRQ